MRRFEEKNEEKIEKLKKKKASVEKFHPLKSSRCIYVETNRPKRETAKLGRILQKEFLAL